MGRLLKVVAFVCMVAVLSPPPAAALQQAEFPTPRYDSIHIPRDWQHEQAGIAAGLTVSPSGVVLAIGYSNTATMMSRFLGQHSPARTVVNGASGGADIGAWANRNEPWQAASDRLGSDAALAGVPNPERRVEVLWLQVASAGPAAPNIEKWTTDLQAIVDRAAAEYPNLRQMYFLGREYGGYGTVVAPDGSQFAGEPANWAHSIAIDQVVAANVGRPDGLWVGTGPYLWTNGAEPRADGLSWQRNEYVTDGRHQTQTAAIKTAGLVNEFFQRDPTAPWFAERSGAIGDVDCSGHLSLLDARAVAQFAIGAEAQAGACDFSGIPLNFAVADIDNNGVVGLLDARRVALCAIGSAVCQ